MKKYKYKAKDYHKKVKKYWKMLETLEDSFYKNIASLEATMAKDLDIEDIEFFWGGDGIVGIGNVSRTLELINRR